MQTTKVYTPSESSSIMAAMQAILNGNNGYATIGNNTETIEALKLAGFVVLPCIDMFGNHTHRGFTKESFEAFKATQKAMATPKPAQRLYSDGPDYEKLILIRQENAGFYD